MKGVRVMLKERVRSKYSRRRRLALLLPGHNEELILAATIESAVAAGLSIQDIYVVDDDSSDLTRAIALEKLPAEHVLTVSRSGKARAVLQAIDYFHIVEYYTWVHVADADSVFCPNYFRIYRKQLNAKQCSAAVGFVQSMRGNWIATYRSFTYTYGQHIFRRIQSWFGVIAVLPGPVTCFKTDIVQKLDFTTGSLTEDFDLTLQIHRKHLGRIKFIPEAVNYTQDPRTIRDFYSQTLRWQRGFFQGLRRYHVCARPHAIDVGVGYQMAESIFYIVQFSLLATLLFISANHLLPLFVLAGDFLVICILGIFSAIAARRLIILASLPYYYTLRLVELAGFLQAFVEIIVLRKFNNAPRGWKTEGRRYEITIDNIKNLQ